MEQHLLSIDSILKSIADEDLENCPVKLPPSSKAIEKPQIKLSKSPRVNYPSPQKVDVFISTSKGQVISKSPAIGFKVVNSNLQKPKQKGPEKKKKVIK